MFNAKAKVFLRKGKSFLTRGVNVSNVMAKVF